MKKLVLLVIACVTVVGLTACVVNFNIDEDSTSVEYKVPSK